MKNWTIALRLKATLTLIIVLLLVGVGLTWWADGHVAQQRLEVNRRHEILIVAGNRIRFDMLQMSDALRGVLLDPKSESERRRQQQADDDLLDAVKLLTPVMTNEPLVLQAWQKVSEYHPKSARKHYRRQGIRRRNCFEAAEPAAHPFIAGI